MTYLKQIVFLLVATTLLLVGCTGENIQIEQNETEDVTAQATSSTTENEAEQPEQVENTENTASVQQLEPVSGKQLTVHFLDVGQGDSIFIQFPNGKTMLIDGGIKGEGNKVVQYIRNFGVTQLDAVVATHPDADHIGGLVPVLNSIKINQFIDSGKVHTSQTYEQMIQLITDKNIAYTVPQTGDAFEIDPEVKIEVLNADEHAEDNNEASIVLKMTYGAVSFLFSGDAGVEKEHEMMALANVQATILKAGHHGSNTSSSTSFIKNVNPEVAILSYGHDNKYGHPHAEVINNLRGVNSKIYGTGESGTIIITTNGATYEVDKDEWTGIGATSSIQLNKPANVQQQQVSEQVGQVRITSKDLQNEIVGITNESTQSVSLNGWKLLSVEGNQMFDFPNIHLSTGETIYITSGSGAIEAQGYIKWTGRQIWLNDGDKAVLYNAKGEVVSELD